MGSYEGFSDQQIREQLQRILLTPAFKSSRILAAFLEFVTGQKLNGKEQEIKEYIIGVHVLGRKADFNPQLDSIVRIHAGRLRRALKEYYIEDGRHDSLVIEIPKGSYVPVFMPREDVETAKPANKISYSRSKPVIAILPFRNISADQSRDFFADGIGEQLTSELTRFNELSIISYYSSRFIAGKTKDPKECALLLGANYIVTGTIQHDENHLRIWAQLISAEKSEQIWARSFERANSASGLFDIQVEITKNILHGIGGYFGAIFRDVMKTPHNMESYDAVFWYYFYQKEPTEEVLRKAIVALQAAVVADPEYALAWAVLAELVVDDKAYEFNKLEDPAAMGLKYAQKAISIDPNCQHGYLSLAWINLFLHNKEECLKAVDQCLAINPNAPDMTGAMGFGLVCAGEFKRGFQLLQDSIEFNPYCPWWFYAGLVFYFLFKKEYIRALLYAEKFDKPDLLWDPLLKAAVLGHLDRQAGVHLERINALLPDVRNQARNTINSFLLSTELQEEIMTGLNKAGLFSDDFTTVESR